MSFPKISVFLLIAMMLSAFISCENGAKLSFYVSSTPQIRYEGRFLTTADSKRFDYPGSRIAIGVDVEERAKVYASLKPNAGYFTLFVDGKEKSQISTYDVPFDGNRLFFLDSLAQGRHQLELVLKSEGLFCQPEFYGFMVGGDFNIYPLERRSKKIEFIGNSITCAYGVEAADETCPFNDSTSNFVRSFAFLTASAFDAEMMVVARSGIGMYRNYADKPEGSFRPMPVVYRNVLISEENTTWDFSSFSPDLLVVNLGTNDLSTEGFRMELLDKAYRDFLTEIRNHYPNTKILLLTGCMLPASPVLDEFQTRLNAIVEDRKQMGDTQIYRYDFAPHDGTLGYGADWHPSLRQQQKMANELIPYVASIMGW